MSDSDHVLFAGVDGVLTSFATNRSVVPNSIPPLDARKPGVVVAVGPVRITAPLGREIGYLQVGDFRQPLLPRRRVWRSAPSQLVFPQPVPSRYWQLDLDAPPAAHARLDLVLSELCNFEALSGVDALAISEAEESLYAGDAKQTSPSPLVLDAIAAIKLRAVPVSQASQEINDKKLPPQRIVSNSYQPRRLSRTPSYRVSSAPDALDAPPREATRTPRSHERPQTAPTHLVTPESPHGERDVGSPTKAVISRFDYFDSPAGGAPLTPTELDGRPDWDGKLGESPWPSDFEPAKQEAERTDSLADTGLKPSPALDVRPPLQPGQEPGQGSPTREPSQPTTPGSLSGGSPTLDESAKTDAEPSPPTTPALSGPSSAAGFEPSQSDLFDPPATPALSADVSASAFILSPFTPSRRQVGAFEATPPAPGVDTALDAVEPVWPPVSSLSRHSISSSSTLDEVLELFTPETFEDKAGGLLDSPTVAELQQRNLMTFSQLGERRDSVRFSHPLIPTPANAISYRMRPPRPTVPQSVYHDVTTISGFVGWQLMNRLLPPRR